MKINTAVRLLMKAKGISQTKMAKMLQVKDQGVIWKRLESSNMRFDTALEMLDIMGYVIVLKEARTGRTRDDEIIITREDEF